MWNSTLAKDFRKTGDRAGLHEAVKEQVELRQQFLRARSRWLAIHKMVWRLARQLLVTRSSSNFKLQGGGMGHHVTFTCSMHSDILCDL